MGMTDINSVRREKDDEEADDQDRDQLQFSNGSSVSEIRRFEIAFDRPEALYFSGDSVTGEVQISLEDTIHVKGVVVRFVGEAYVNVPADDEGSEGSNAGATWQKRCKNLKVLATRRKRNKVQPSDTGVSNRGFSDTKSSKSPQTETAPHVNGGHKIKCVTPEDEEASPESNEETASTPDSSDDTEVIELDGDTAERPSLQQTTPLETVKEEDEDLGEQPPKHGEPPSQQKVAKEEGKEVKKAEKKKEKKEAKKGKSSSTSSKRQQQQGGADKRKAATKFRAHEKYFDYRFYVFGHKYSSAREHLSSGAHRFRFSYVLPGKLPSCFHGRFGYVRYFCEASLERAWAPSITRKAFFSVSASVDVNREPRAESGAGGHRSTHGCLFCCPRGTVIAEAGVKRRGFVPGERIPLRAHILNVSDRRVRRTRARLLQVVTYHSNNGCRSKVDEVVVTEAIRGEVPKGEADTWGDEEHHQQQEHQGKPKGVTPSGVALDIPPLPANFKCNEFCKIIDVDYRLDFVVEVEGEPEPMHIRMPIVVGTIPLERVFRTMILGPRRRSSVADKGDGLTVMVPGSSQYVEFPQPRFEACTWGPRHVEAYFHQEVARKLGEEEETKDSDTGAAAKAAKSATPVAAVGAAPGIGTTLRVHRKGETFAPRYVCYSLRDPDAVGSKGADGKSVGEMSLSPLSPGLKVPPAEAWIPRDTSETELVSPGSGPSRSKRH